MEPKSENGSNYRSCVAHLPGTPTMVESIIECLKQYKSLCDYTLFYI